MSDNINSIIIGGIPTQRGVYNANSTYYEGNQVVYLGSVFSAKSNNFSNIPPLSVAADGTVSIANTVYWEIITDNVELYNATLSEKSLSKRIETLETDVSTVTSDASTAKTTASGAKTIASTAKDTADKAARDVAALKLYVSTNTNDIAANKKAITALQLGASPLEYECHIDGDVVEWDIKDNQDGENLSIPFKVLDGDVDVTENAETVATIMGPEGSKVNLKGKLSSLDTVLTTPGEYTIEIKSTINGRSANATWKFVLAIPIMASKIFDDIDAQVGYKTYVTSLPASITVAFDNKFEGTLRIFSPSFLTHYPIVSCNGVQVPTSNTADDKYIMLDYTGGVQNGVYNFTINKQ